MIHEVNVPPGVANRMGMRFTKHVAVGFPHQPAQAESLRDARVVGVPLRTVDRPTSTGRRCAPQARAHFGLRPDLPVLFVSGGSQGARSINLAVAGAAKALAARRRPGAARASAPATSPSTVPSDLPVPYVALPYLSEMELGYAAADLMLVPGRRDDLRRDGRGRPAGGLRAATRTATRSSGATRCRWWRPAAACWSTTPS